jgi:hypothetical protein
LFLLRKLLFRSLRRFIRRSLISGSFFRGALSP